VHADSSEIAMIVEAFRVLFACAIGFDLSNERADLQTVETSADYSISIRTRAGSKSPASCDHRM